MSRKTRTRLFSTWIACTLAGCVGSKPSPAPAEKQEAVTNEAKSSAARPGGPQLPGPRGEGDLGRAAEHEHVEVLLLDQLRQQ